MKELKNAAGSGFDDGLHHQLPALIQDGDHNGFLVHVHSDIFDVVTHLSCLLGGKEFLLTVIFLLKVKMPFSRRLAYVLLRFLRTSFTNAVVQLLRPSQPRPSEAGRFFIRTPNKTSSLRQ